MPSPRYCRLQFERLYHPGIFTEHANTIKFHHFASQHGITLIDYFIVSIIISILAVLLIPAIHHSREKARRNLCSDHLKQIGQAVLKYETVMKHFPPGGWIAWFLGHPDRGQDMKQPGGWIFNILSHLEQPSLYNLQSDKKGKDAQVAALQLIQTPLSIFICPSRRQCKPFIQPNAIQQAAHLNWQMEFYGDGTEEGSGILTGTTPVARNDYCANGYDLVKLEEAFGNPAIATAASSMLTRGVPAADDILFNNPEALNGLLSMIRSSRGGLGGLVCPFIHITLDQIGDGANHTYLCGEKYVDSACYENGECWGDQANMYSGYDAGNVRFSCIETYPTVAQDNKTINFTTIWGSAHPSGFNMCFCDGSVRCLSYGISFTVHDQFGNRNDGQLVNIDTFQTD